MDIETLINNISKKLAIITYYIRFENSANLNSINTLLENSFKNILNIVYGYNLKNLNTNYLYPAIDLGDEINKIAVQVTSTNDLSKIKDTLDRFKNNGFEKKYDKLKFVIIDDKKAYRPKINLDTEYFSLKNDVISVFDSVKIIKDIEIMKQKEIDKLLDEVIGKNNMDISLDVECNEVKTIINIIQTLSNDSEDEEIVEESMPNPTYKINERFKEYKEYLNDMFLELYPIYMPVFNKIQRQFNVGTTQTKKIAIYLKKESKLRLIKFNGDLIVAYDDMVNMLEEKLKKYSVTNFDKNAIEFYIIKNIVDCNVFPND